MPKPFPKEFRDDVIRVAENRDPEVTLAEIAKAGHARLGVVGEEAEATSSCDGGAAVAIQHLRPCPWPTVRSDKW